MNTASNPTKTQTALIVDDDEFSRDVMIGMLEELGISKVRTAVDGNDGLRVLNEMSVAPDILICDILMPDMDGMSFLTELAKVKYPGRVALVSGIDNDILNIAEKVVRDDGLKIIGAFLKPIKLSHLSQIVSDPIAGELWRLQSLIHTQASWHSKATNKLIESISKVYFSLRTVTFVCN